MISYSVIPHRHDDDAHLACPNVSSIFHSLTQSVSQSVRSSVGYLDIYFRNMTWQMWNVWTKWREKRPQRKWATCSVYMRWFDERWFCLSCQKSVVFFFWFEAKTKKNKTKINRMFDLSDEINRDVMAYNTNFVRFIWWDAYITIKNNENAESIRFVDGKLIYTKKKKIWFLTHKYDFNEHVILNSSPQTVIRYYLSWFSSRVRCALSCRSQSFCEWRWTR